MKKRIPVILMLVPLVLVILAAGLLNSASADTLIYCTWGEDATARWFYDHATKCSKYAFLYASPTGSWDDAVEVKQLPASYDYCFGEYDLNDEVSAYAVEHGQEQYYAIRVELWYGYEWRKLSSTFRQFTVVHLNGTYDLDYELERPDGFTTIKCRRSSYYAFKKEDGLSMECILDETKFRFTGWWNGLTGNLYTLKNAAPILRPSSVLWLEPRVEYTKRLDEVSLSLVVPDAGTSSADPYGLLIVPESSRDMYAVSAAGTGWYKNGVPFTGRLEGGSTYNLRIKLIAVGGHAFALYYSPEHHGNITDVTLNCNGQQYACLEHVVDQANQDLWVLVDVPVRIVPWFNVTFDMNGHGTAPAAQSVREGGTAVRPATPAAAGYRFGGWYTDSACTQAYDFSSPVKADITLYAKWSAYVDGVGVWFKGPSAGKRVSDVSFMLTENTDRLSLYGVGWERETRGGWVAMSDTDRFTAGTEYRATIVVQAINGYAIPAGTKPTVNGQEAYVDRDHTTSSRIVFQAGWVSAPEVTLTFDNNGYGSQIPTQTMMSGFIPREPAAPTSPDAVFMGYVRVIVVDRETFLEPFSFDDPLTENTLVRLMWNPYISEVKLWMNPPVPGEASNDDALFTRMAKGEKGYSILGQWYDTPPAGTQSGEPFHGTFAAGQTYYFRVLIGSLEGKAFHPDGLTVTIENAAVSGVTVHSYNDRIFYADCSYTPTWDGIRTITFDAAGHGDDPAPLYVAAGTRLGDIFRSGAPRRLEDAGYYMDDWLLNGNPNFVLREHVNDSVDEDLPLTALWLEVIPQVRVWLDEPVAGQTPGGTHPLILGSAEHCSLLNWIWDDGSGNEMDSGEPFTDGQQYRLTLYVVADEGYCFHHSEGYLNGAKVYAANYSPTDSGELKMVESRTIGEACTIHFDVGEHGEALPDIIVPEGANAVEAITVRLGRIPVLPDEGDVHFVGWVNADVCPEGLDDSVTVAADLTLTPTWVFVLREVSVRIPLPFENDPSPRTPFIASNRPVIPAGAKWIDAQEEIVTSLSAGEAYTLRLDLSLGEGVALPEDGNVTVTVNGRPAETVFPAEGPDLRVLCPFTCQSRRTAALPEELTVLEPGAFDGTDFNYIYLPDSLTSIPAGAFGGCGQLQIIRLSWYTEEIGEGAFDGCPDTLTFTGGNDYTDAWAEAHGILVSH